MSTEVVTTPAQLSSAVANMDVDFIYLGADITIPYFGIIIPPSKESLTFDGTYEGTRYRLTDVNNSLPTSTLRVDATSDISLTFQNMDMTGRNYYGIPYISDVLVDTSGVSVTYINVTYEGPQLVFNPLGRTRFEGCTVTANVEEIGECNRVEFVGVNTLTHNALPSTDNAAFWIRGDADTAYFRVMQDARVTITTTNYFMYSLNLLFAQIPPAWEVLSGASLDITSYRGISYTPDHRAASFFVGAGASFKYIQQTANSSHASFYINGGFIVASGASIYMQADFDNSYPLVNFASASAQPLALSGPKSFVLYDRSSEPIAFSPGVSRDFVLSGGQINTWLTAAALPDAGDFLDTPYRKWHRPNWNEFNITGSADSDTTTVSGTSLTPDEQALMPSVDDLVFQTARVISVGHLPIIPDLMADDGRPISGFTEPNAKLMISYTVEGEEFLFEPTAGADGIFVVPTGNPVPAGTVITIKANTPFLVTGIEITVVAAVNEIILQKTPDPIAFRLPSISAGSDIFLRRVNPSEAVEVLDNRSVLTSWNLLASITGPLTTASGEVSGNAVVFRDENGNVLELSATPAVIYTGVPFEGQTDIVWPVDNGILVRVTEPIRAGVEYTTTLRWDLETI